MRPPNSVTPSLTNAPPLRLARAPPPAQVTAATYKRLRGRAAAQLRDAQARLSHVSTQVRLALCPARRFTP
jgi:hypothetical protein